LRAEPIGRESDFFQLGGDSIKAIKLIAKLKESFDAAVPVSHVFAASRVHELAALVTGHRFLEDSGEILTVFNPGQAANIFAFPPAAAYGISYLELAAHLKGFSIYAFNFIDDPRRLERYAAAILDAQPQGPYVLLGYSAGGVLCMQTAEEIEKRGGQVSGIILLDCYTAKGEPVDTVDTKPADQHLEFLTRQLKALGAESLIETVSRTTRNYFQYFIQSRDFSVIDADIHFIEAEPEALPGLRQPPADAGTRFYRKKRPNG
jgi:pimeloyl-ACP methyl ester carboxylesterase